MAAIAIVFGIVLTLLGGGFFAATGFDMAKFTALIPAFFGLPLILFGALARNDKYRMHAMHGAALLGLVGFAVPLVMVVLAVVVNSKPFEPFKHGEQLAMAVICAIFLGLCVKSFIDARAARKAKETQPANP